MGPAQSKSSTQSTVDLETVNQAVTNYLNQQTSSASAQVTNINSLTTNIVNACPGCNINAAQTINTNTKALTTLTSVQADDIISKIRDSANTSIDQAAAASAGAFATNSANANNVSIYKNHVSDIITNNMTTQIVQNAFAAVHNGNSNQINIQNCGCCTPVCSGALTKLDFSQNIINQVSASAITDTITTALSNLDTTFSTITGVTQRSTSHTSGLDDVIKAIGDAIASILSALTGPWAMGAIACIIVSCLLCVAIVFMGASGGSKSGNGGANPKQ